MSDARIEDNTKPEVLLDTWRILFVIDKLSMQFAVHRKAARSETVDRRDYQTNNS
jgi:hypothetical protein